MVYIIFILQIMSYAIPFIFLSIFISIPIFFTIKKKKSNKCARISIFFIFVIVFIFLIICYGILRPIDYYFRITNFSNKNIIIEGIFLHNKLLFRGEYALKPSDRNGEWLGDNAIQLDAIKIFPFQKKDFKILFRDDSGKQKNRTIEIIDDKKRGCFFYFIYDDRGEFSWKCIKLFVDN